jgi:hypothetical protein
MLCWLPQVVVTALGENDLLNAGLTILPAFQVGYTEFLTDVRQTYRGAHILVALEPNTPHADAVNSTLKVCPRLYNYDIKTILGSMLQPACCCFKLDGAHHEKLSSDGHRPLLCVQ